MATPTCCPTCGIAAFDPETSICSYCEETQVDRAADAAIKPVLRDPVMESMTVDAARAHVMQVDDLEELERLLVEEHKHAKYEGGRNGVVKLLDAKIADAKAAREKAAQSASTKGKRK